MDLQEILKPVKAGRGCPVLGSLRF